MVVQGSSERGVEAVTLAGPDAPLVHQGIGRLLIGGVPDPGVKLLRRVELRPVGIKGHSGQLRKNQGAPPAERILHAGIERAAQEDGAFGVEGSERRSPAAQIQ